MPAGTLWGVQDGAEGGGRLPGTLWEAVVCMEENPLMEAVLGREFVSRYAAAKKAEWKEYMSSISEWEVERYLYRT